MSKLDIQGRLVVASTRTFSVTISDEDVRERLDQWCRERGVTRSVLLRRLVSRFMDELRAEDARWEDDL
ncbi:ribbon-helix-helix protein, CopG family [Saccharomonospora iraqiensis]|uniref:ribbon-helix-helix protein, CopG family n=1 Tax=Saccharomonospora iraqiensis TaxID=52698 RepID=UPI0012B63E61